MSSPWKYIIILSDGAETPLIFPANLSHDDVAGRFNVVSAGFCYFKSIPIKGKFDADCFGESLSLGIKSRLCDDKIIEEYLQLMKY